MKDDNKKAKVNKQELTSQIITDNILGSFLGYMPNPDDIAPGTLSSYGTYRKMKTDPRIKSLLNKLKTSALNFPVRITQPDGCDDEVFKVVESSPLWKKLYQKMKRILSGLDYGFSVSELIWDFSDSWCLPDNIITRKPERFGFGHDWKLYHTELCERKRLEHPYKWLEYHHDPDDENPYGTSVLRCVYWAWMFKQAGYEFWLQATEKFSVKTIIALFKAEGDDERVRRTARDVAEQLMGVSSGSAAAVGNVDSIQELGMTGDLIGFSSLVDSCDNQISYGLTGQSIATSKTEGGSLALGEVQAELFYEDAKGIALELQSVLQKIVNWTVEVNGYANMAAPILEFDVERRANFSQVMTAIDHGVEVSKDALYTLYGVPKPRDKDDAYVRQADQGGFELSDSDDGKKKARERKQEERRAVRVI